MRPIAACAMIVTERTRVGQVTPEIARHSPRNGFNGFLRALPGDRAFLPPSPAASSRELDASVGASGPHDFAVRARLHKSRSTVLVPVRRSFSEGGSAPLVLRRRRVHRIPHPTFVTTAKRPSYRGRDARKDAGDLGLRSTASGRGRLARRANQSAQGSGAATL